MYKALFVLLITLISSSISYANDSTPCFKSKKYINHNNLENLIEINIEIIKMDKWLNNAFTIVRNNGWIKKDLKKNHKANIYFQFNDGFKCSDKAKVRFHGDNPDHYRFEDDLNFVSSLNIKLLNANINNITEFKLLLPETRFDEREIITTNLLKKLNFIAPRTKKIKVSINKNELEYLFQEKITKELVEFNNFPEGPIIDDDQDSIWLTVDIGNGASCHVGYRSCFYRSIPLGPIENGRQVEMKFTEKEKKFDPEKVYKGQPNPTKI